MKKVLLFLISSFLISYGAAGPKLVVVVVVDQLRADYLDRYGSDFKKGFRRLLNEGKIYSNAVINYTPSDTGPGHAAIATGKTPRETGIVGNWWWDKEENKRVYVVKDNKGVFSPSRLKAETFGDQLKKQSPESLVYSVSFKDRAAILMGGQSPDLVAWFDTKQGAFRSSSYYIGLPTWVEAFNKEKDPFPSARRPISKSGMEKFQVSPASDKHLLDFSLKLLSESPLGQDDTTDLFMVSFSGTDYTGHRYGPFGPEMKQQLQALDGYLGKLFQALDEKVGKANYGVALTADHGVLPLVESKEGEDINARRISTRQFRTTLEETVQRLFPLPEEEWIVGFHLPHIYFNRALIQDLGLKMEAFLSRVTNSFYRVDGIADVYDPSRLNNGEAYTSIYQEGIHPGRSGDLLLRLDKGLLVKKYYVRTGHGSPYAYDTRVPMIFWGAGVEKGKSEEKIPLTDFSKKVREFIPAWN